MTSPLQHHSAATLTATIAYTLDTGEKLVNETFGPNNIHRRHIGIMDPRPMQVENGRPRAGEFSLDDFKSQLSQLVKPGLMKKLMGMIPGMGDMGQMMGEANPEEDAVRLIGIIDSMTMVERRNPKVIDPSRRNRIAKGAGVQTQEVTQLLKQYDAMAPMMKKMASGGIGDRMKMVQELQQSGMMNPGAQLRREKVGTGKRLSPKERAELKKQREKELRRKKRTDRDK